MKKYVINKGGDTMSKVYAVTQTDLEDTNPCKTWIFDDKKTAYEFLCNKYEKAWNKYHIPYENGECDVIDNKSKYPFVDGYKNNDFQIGEYYNIYFSNNTEIIFGICQIVSTHIKTGKPDISKDYYSGVGEDIKEAFKIAERMMKNPDEITFGDMIWLCEAVGMRREILRAKEGTWLNVVEDALRKLGYRI